MFVDRSKGEVQVIVYFALPGLLTPSPDHSLRLSQGICFKKHHSSAREKVLEDTNDHLWKKDG